MRRPVTRRPREGREDRLGKERRDRLHASVSGQGSTRWARTMKTFILLLALAISATAHAGKRIESCESAELIPGKGWVYTPTSCPVDVDESSKEKACGKDYGELRIGMTIKRFEQCNEAVTIETDTVSKDGSIKLYSSTFWWIRVKSGRIVSYTRRTF